MAWAFLIAAGVFEIAATTAFRFVEGFTRLVPTLAFALTGIASLYCLNKAVADIPLGTAYAVWTGVGAAGTVLVGLAFFDEPAGTLRLAFLVVLVGAIIGLRLTA